MSEKKFKLHPSGNPALDVRFAALYAIAKAWQDEKLLETLTTHHYPTEWLNSHGYQSPSESFGIKFLPPEAEWNIFGDHQWTKHKKETIEITLPILPEKYQAKEKEDLIRNEYERAEKLIEYYSHFPTFFGVKNRKKSINDEPTRSTIPVDPHGDNYNLGDSPDLFLSFSAALIKLIAAMWENKSLLAKLDYNDPSNFKDDQKYYEKTLEIFSRYFKYDCEWKFNIRFIKPASDKNFWDENGEWNYDAGVRNTIYIEIPTPPGRNPENRENFALALARYNSMGPAYPFTCS